MGSVTTGRPLNEDGEPTDGPALELDPDGAAADLFREASRPLASSPGAGMWSTILRFPEAEAGPNPAMLLWLAPDAIELPPHVHETETEKFRALEGELTVVVDGDEHSLVPGEELTVLPGQEHYFRNDTDEFAAVYAEVPWRKTIETQYTFFGLDHEGAFGSDGEYGEPGVLQGILLGRAVREETTITAMPVSAQRLLWATVGPVADVLGYRAVDERYLRDEFWESRVEQPDL